MARRRHFAFGKVQIVALRLADFQIDIWFLYGSFAYGVESVLSYFGPDALGVNVLGTNDAEQKQDVSAFLDDLTENPKGLLRTELRIYGPEGHAVAGQAGLGFAHPVQFPVTLVTERVPASVEAPMGHLQLRFEELRALTAPDQAQFALLVAQVWPKLFP